MAASLIKSAVSITNRRKLTSTANGLNFSGTEAIITKGVEMGFQVGHQHVQVLKGIDLEIKKGDIQL